MSANDIALLVALVASGLMAGLWFAWVVSVIPGHRRVDDHTYVSSMQNNNVAIINPLFMVTFMGTPVILIAAAIVAFQNGQSKRGWWLVVSAATYVVGVLGVTIGRNVPLNDRLAAFELDGASVDEIAAQRRAYEAPWNRWHNVRTVASTVSFGLASVAALVGDDG